MDQLKAKGAKRVSELPRMLVVDDEVAICELIREVATSVGFDVETASDGYTIDAKLGAGHAVTVLDLSLAGDDGVTAMRTLAARNPGSAVIVASGAPERVLSSAQKVAGMYGLNVVGVCAKPLSIDALQAVLRNALDSVGITPEVALTSTEIADRMSTLSIADVELAYQPMIELHTGVVVSAEVFSRWHPVQDRGLGPGEFVPELERSGDSGELLAHVATQAAADRLKYPALAALPTVGINISARDLDALNLPEQLHTILTSAAPAHRWTLEVTETAAIGAPDRSLDVITRLSLMEFQLSIDDFGTGTSNLERLRWYPFTELKIDRSFLNDVSSENSSDWIIVRNAVAMGQQLGLEIVAEGVEDTRTLRRLRELGCDRAQGYLVSPPVPAADFADRVQAWAQTAESLFA